MGARGDPMAPDQMIGSRRVHEDITKLVDIIKKNLFPANLIERVVNCYVAGTLVEVLRRLFEKMRTTCTCSLDMFTPQSFLKAKE